MTEARAVEYDLFFESTGLLRLIHEQREARLRELYAECDQLISMSAVVYAERYGIELMSGASRRVADTFCGGGVSVIVTLDPSKGDGWWCIRTPRYERYEESAGLARLLKDAGVMLESGGMYQRREEPLPASWEEFAKRADK